MCYYYFWNFFFFLSSRFRIDNTDHIIDVKSAQDRPPFRYESVDIICPLYRRGHVIDHPSNVETFAIYLVNKEEYDTCRLMGDPPRMVARCDDPYTFKVFTISFRSFSPMPGGMTFRPGRDYYFISTSSREDLDQKSGGMCHENNMKVMFKVNRPDEDRKKKRKKEKGRDQNSLAGQEEDLVFPRLDGSSPSSSSSPEPFDYFLNQARNGEEAKKDTNLVMKQEASTAGADAVGARSSRTLETCLGAFLLCLAAR